jgi:hypothetical protein
MQGEKFGIKDIGLALGAAGNGRIDDAGRSFPGKKDGEMIGRCTFNAVMEGRFSEVRDGG